MRRCPKGASSPADGRPKAALAPRGVEFPFSHDLARLMELCESAGVSLPSVLADADRLTPYAVRFRYGSAVPGDVTRGEAAAWATEALAWADGVVNQNPPRDS